VPATLTTRLERLEAAQRTIHQERHNAGMQALGRTMDPEHVRLVQDWMRERLGGLKARIALPGESPYATFARLGPPALVRAVWLLLDAQVRTGCPVSLAPQVAEVYLADPDAWPMAPCEGCQYPLPMRGNVHPDGSFSDVAYYLGTCPVCGLDNYPEEEATP
jgi:hypothetical protein